VADVRAPVTALREDLDRDSEHALALMAFDDLPGELLTANVADWSQRVWQ
jgi:hypothetical protein